MTQFILNDKDVVTELPQGLPLLDFIRYHKHLTGTKIGCREGDCGACTVLVGEYSGGEMVYRSSTSCLMAIGSVQGKHIVTIEGLNMDELNPIQKAMSDEGATQCGFCTPGFVVSLAGFCLSNKEPDLPNAIAAIDGNICRCTGYKSIEKATAKVVELMQQRKGGAAVLYATMHKLLPGYFNNIKERLASKAFSQNGNGKVLKDPVVIGGGTDLYVQRHETMPHTSLQFASYNQEARGIKIVADRCEMSGATVVTDMLESAVFQQYFPKLRSHLKLVSSTPIRNMATVAGNFINASPIGDLTIFFLALNAQVMLTKGRSTRDVPLRNFYKGYKIIDKKPDEIVERIWFDLPPANSLFNFEKVSKRTHLDIASVNTAIHLTMNGERIGTAGLSAGGVGPVPLFLKATSGFLTDKVVDENMIEEAVAIAMTEISPISDARGAAEYKSLLLSQLIKAHFITLFPAVRVEKLLQLA